MDFADEPDLPRDPTGLPPTCDEETFARLLAEMAAYEAPRRFAVAQEWGTRVDARIAGWGLAFEDRAEVFSVDSSARMCLKAPESALRMFARGEHISARIIWLDPEPEEPEPEE
ncbi:hypothetical protein [Longispora fulva]|uniref:Uncharacterized protein n=1 Tax=Longispora fulva TaxID=619741 RepID=A0A8J7GUB2_9ACTN|nr:hypothetical protein [Longispora fulva]MBG6139655.1 hypothetical protein [Longispora fulva]